MADTRKQTPSPLPSSRNNHSHNHDDVQGIDIIKATRKPTKVDHFRALVAHNFRVTLRDPTVYIFGSVIPIIMIGAAVGISLGIQSGIPKIETGAVDTRVFTAGEAGLESSYVTKPVVYFPVVQAIPGLTNLTDSVVQNLGQIYRPFNPYFANFSSMDDIASYEHANGEAMLKNKTLEDYKPQIGFELDALAASTSTSGALDLGFTLLSAKNDSIPYLLSALNAFTQNVDATSGTSGGAAGTGLRFLSTLKTFAAQGSENVDIPSFIVPSFMTFAFSFFTTFVAANLVAEKEHGQKQHLQNMGIKPITYYLARYVIDLISFLIPIVACFVILGAARLQMITSGSWVPYLIVLLFAGFPVISFGYLLSLPFQKSQSVGQVLGIGLSLIVFVPYFFVQFVFNGASNLAIVLVGCITPTFAMERAISSIATSSTSGNPYTIAEVFDIQKPVFCAILVFVGITIVHFCVIFYIESRTQSRRSFFRKINNNNNNNNNNNKKHAESHLAGGALKRQDTTITFDGKYRERDAEVIEETLRLKGSEDENDAVRLLGLSKKFYIKSKKRDLIILDDVYLAFKKNECFGYLGPNGAGKTTTIKMLTGAESPTSGGGTIEGLPIAPFHDDLRSMIGICPQFDIIWPKLTVRDHLELFAKIKGVAPEDLNAAVDQMVDEMGLGPLGNKRAKTFSGGNKRRLSLAMAVIGCPKVVFLDEPTTGVDVAIRQAIWNSIRKLKKTSCVILTTHSMEEADALCDRIGIITNGHIQALGTSQRLKNTYGAGYKVIVKTYANRHLVTGEMEHTVGVGRVTLVQALGSSLEYELTRVEGERTTDMLAKLFTLFEQKRKELGIEDYSVSQTTLAQVFIEFAKEQAAPEDK